MKPLQMKFIVIDVFFPSLPPTAMAAEPSADALEKIAKMTVNPIGAEWMLWTQNNYSLLKGDLIGDEALTFINLQPVIPDAFRL